MVIDKIKKVNQVEEIQEKNKEATDKMIGKWIKCEKCGEILYKEEVKANLSVCTNCGHHFRISSRRRISQIIDEGTFEEINENMHSKDPIKFDGYMQKLEILQSKTGIKEAVKTGIGEIEGERVAIAVMDSNFMMGSMGSVVGEKITYLVEEAI